MNRPRKKDRHLPDCVYFKHGAYWYAKRGKWTRLPRKGASTLASALEAYADLVEAPRGGMATLIDEALEAMKPGLKKNTVDQYEIAGRKLKKMLAEFAPDQVKGKHAVQIKKALKATPNMANRVLSFARQVFDYALEEELPGIEGNPFGSVRRHKEGKRDRLISWAEYEAIYAQSGPRLQVITDLAIRTGQRITAVLRIKRTDLLPEGIRFGHHKTPTKGIIKWTPELREVIERARLLYGNVVAPTLLYARRRSKRFATAPFGPPAYKTVYDQWVRACKDAGVENANMHDLRALAATEAQKQGMNPTALLQHSSPAQTRRYLRGKEEPVVDGPSFRQSIDTVKKP